MCEAAGLTGHLQLICDLDNRGLSRLRHQSFRAPFHLSKPYHDEGVLVVNVVNPTAGLMDGDRLWSEVVVESGARLLLTTPSASRVHTMRGGYAEAVQSYRVMSGGSLEVWPEILIPQKGARYRQHTDVELAESAQLLLFEGVAPGRVASGEILAFEELRWATNVRVGQRLIARERYRLAPAHGSLGSLRRHFPCPYYASGLLVSPAFDAKSACWDMLLGLQGDNVWIGMSALGKDAFALKLLASDSLVFRRTLYTIRKAIYDALGRPPPALRRAGDPFV